MDRDMATTDPKKKLLKAKIAVALHNELLTAALIANVYSRTSAYLW